MQANVWRLQLPVGPKVSVSAMHHTKLASTALLLSRHRRKHTSLTARSLPAGPGG